MVYGPVPPAIVALNWNVAGALPDVAFETISAVRGSVAGGSSVGGCSGSTCVNKSSTDNPTNAANPLKFSTWAIASIASGLVIPGVSANASESDAPAIS